MDSQSWLQSDELKFIMSSTKQRSMADLTIKALPMLESLPAPKIFHKTDKKHSYLNELKSPTTPLMDKESCIGDAAPQSLHPPVSFRRKSRQGSPSDGEISNMSCKSNTFTSRSILLADRQHTMTIIMESDLKATIPEGVQDDSWRHLESFFF